MTLLFSDDFNALSLWNGWSYSAGAGTWMTTFGAQIWRPRESNGWSHNMYTGGPGPDGSQEWYIDHLFAPTQSVKPWNVNNGILSISLDRASDAIKPLIGYDGSNGSPVMLGQFDYTSGYMDTALSFNFTHGYVEFRAQMPDAWGALWLWSSNPNDRGEIDVMESFQPTGNEVNQNIHSWTGGIETQLPTHATSATLKSQMHTYAVDWQPDVITFYFDGKETAHYATPDDLHDPMHVVMNVGLGGTWQGDDFSKIVFPTSMLVDYVQVWDTNPHLAAVKMAGTSRADVETGGGADDSLSGGSGNDTLNGLGGKDTLTGGPGNDLIIGGVGNDLLAGSSGDDTFVFAKWFGRDVVSDFAAGRKGNDVIQFQGFGAERPTLSETGGDSVFSFGSTGDVLRLVGVRNADLASSDWLFT